MSEMFRLNLDVPSDVEIDASEAIDVIKNEIACVRRADNCIRDCLHCDLVMPDHVILAAYQLAIEALRKQIPAAPHVTLMRYTAKETKEELCVPFKECPNCRDKMKTWAFVDKDDSYCKRCGQAINWKED